MSAPYLGQLQAFSFSFTPRGWIRCDGALQKIANYPDLFNVLGVSYGGDGQTTFGVPDLRGRAPMGAGAGPGLTPRQIGEMLGQATVSLSIVDLPAHSHTLMASSQTPGTKQPADASLAAGEIWNSPAAPDTPTSFQAISSEGFGSPHMNLQPLLVVNWCIAAIV